MTIDLDRFLPTVIPANKFHQSENNLTTRIKCESYETQSDLYLVTLKSKRL